MAYTNIDDPSAHFQVATWSGTGSSNAVTFDGNSDMQPDLVWSKRRDVGYNHVLKTTSIGGTSDNDIHLVPNLGNAKSTYSNYRMDFNSDGFTADAQGDQGFNASGSSMVSWCWKANGGTTSSNTDGSLTSTVQANTTAGFSILTYTGDNTAAQTIGHGLGAVPQLIIVKRTNSNNRNWAVYHANSRASSPEDVYGRLDTADGFEDNAAYWNDTAPTSSVFTVGTGNNSRVNSGDLLALCFTEKQGYSKFGDYYGTNHVDGQFVYTGFKPAFVVIKLAEASTGGSWAIFDNKRSDVVGANQIDKEIAANEDTAEYDRTNANMDFLSNGFKLRNTDGWHNTVANFVFFAFAEQPFVTSTGIPTTAR